MKWAAEKNNIKKYSTMHNYDMKYTRAENNINSAAETETKNYLNCQLIIIVN